MLSFFIEHMFLLVICAFDRKAIHSEICVCRHPLAYGRQRNDEQLRREPRSGLRGLREENLDLLPPGVRRVVALVLVVRQSRVIPDAIRQLAEIVAQSKRLQQPLRSLCQRAAQLGITGQHALELTEPGFPLAPARINIRKVPGKCFGDVAAAARTRIDRSLGSHTPILVDLQTTRARRARTRSKKRATRRSHTTSCRSAGLFQSTFSGSDS